MPKPEKPDHSEMAQMAHYEKISEEYEKHYAEPSSLLYRERFCHEPMFSNVALGSRRVLDAMCGSGPLSAYLRKQGAEVTGLDISPTAMASYQANNPDCHGVCGSILNSPFESETFDAIGVVGGLHHLPPNLDRAIKEMHRILKPGGSLCFAEPQSQSLLDRLRHLWYYFDPLFESNEEAINLESLKKHQDLFHFCEQHYFGNVAYILVLNSMILRIPPTLKPYYSPLAVQIEVVLNRILPKWLSCAVVCRWTKR